MRDLYQYRELLNKLLLLFGIVIIIYAVLWILAKLNIIPLIIFSIFPQIILLIVGIFIVYQALNNRRVY